MMADITTKSCKKCSRFLPINLFGLFKTKTSNGIRGVCIECRKLQNKKWYIRDLDINRKKRAEWQNKYGKEWRKNPSSKELLKKCNYSWRVANRERSNTMMNIAWSKRNSAKLTRIPKWANLDDIKNFYKIKPKGMVVDHIIPLQGIYVSGLHVRENLQYLTASENSIKGNRYVQ